MDPLVRAGLRPNTCTCLKPSEALALPHRSSPGAELCCPSRSGRKYNLMSKTDHSTFIQLVLLECSWCANHFGIYQDLLILCTPTTAPRGNFEAKRSGRQKEIYQYKNKTQLNVVLHALQDQHCGRLSHSPHTSSYCQPDPKLEKKCFCLKPQKAPTIHSAFKAMLKSFVSLPWHAPNYKWFQFSTSGSNPKLRKQRDVLMVFVQQNMAQYAGLDLIG
ncbi:PREDICTED: uncharacterized protein LOC106147594 [Chinchilla lanigera]|uniref:uncharacterized protein LOC106147594 n=1 Tax=Chinchilla lanigera TaxID=34839 RepID=UPI0006973E34|nr:PREDICTED: uncharacterized protein LOC106147594 [Chinchilla lanigera]